MGRKPKTRMYCDKCGKTMEVSNTSNARHTVFVLWKCVCGYQRLEKQRIPLGGEFDFPEPPPSDEIPEYCTCGIKLKPIGTTGAVECPRCQLVIPPKGQEHVEIVMVEKDLTTYDFPTEPTGLVAPEEPTQDCMVCNATMEAGCKKVCPNCNWVSPCSTEGP